jgi:hypothetical protein
MAIVLDGTNGINTPDLESAGPVSGTTGTFSGAVTAASVQAGGVATNIYPLVSATAVSASGTSVDFTGIPSWVRRITVMFSGVSTNGSSLLVVQLGATSFTTSGYTSTRSGLAGSTGFSNTVTTGLLVGGAGAATTLSGVTTLCALSGNTWVQAGTFNEGPTVTSYSAGNVTISGVLDRIRITTVNGTDTFDAGTINILYE